MRRPFPVQMAPAKYLAIFSASIPTMQMTHFTGLIKASLFLCAFDLAVTSFLLLQQQRLLNTNASTSVSMVKPFCSAFAVNSRFDRLYIRRTRTQAMVYSQLRSFIAFRKRCLSGHCSCSPCKAFGWCLPIFPSLYSFPFFFL